jgi:hypothetical protein
LATVGLTAQAPPDLAGAINFAGGRGSRSAGVVCGDRALVDVFRQFGTTSRTPMLWVYAGNDGFFSPALAHRFRDAFVAGGGKVSFIDAPAFGDDGHFLFSNTSASDWTPIVDRFLRAQNLMPQSASAATLPAPTQLSAAGKEAFSNFISRNQHKAFAVSPEGAFGWRSGMPSADDAERDALAAFAELRGLCRRRQAD